MKLGNCPDILQSATLFVATTLAACGGSPATQVEPQGSAPEGQLELSTKAFNWDSKTPDVDPTSDRSTERALSLIEHSFVRTLFEKFRFIDDPQKFLATATSGELDGLKFEPIPGSESGALRLTVDEYRAEILPMEGWVTLSVYEGKWQREVLSVTLSLIEDQHTQAGSSVGVQNYTPTGTTENKVIIDRDLGSKKPLAFTWQQSPENGWSNLRNHRYISTTVDGVFDMAIIAYGVDGGTSVEVNYNWDGQKWVSTDLELKKAKDLMTSVRREIAGIETAPNARIDMEGIVNTDGYYVPRDGELTSMAIYDGLGMPMTTSVSFSLSDPEMFQIEKEGTRLHCVGPFEAVELVEEEGIDPNDWVCSIGKSDVEHETLLRIDAETVGIFLKVREDINRMAQKVRAQ